MGLTRDELGDAARTSSSSSRPLAPAQAAVLHDVVIHVYVAGGERVPQHARAASGFLGVLLEPVLTATASASPPHARAAGRERSAGLRPVQRERRRADPRDLARVLRAFASCASGDVVLGIGRRGAEPTRRADGRRAAQPRVQATSPGRDARRSRCCGRGA